ncbi:LIS1 (LisH) motif [Carpediemonas membranifera]|uniref:LIS1 (LisH) motif n=1 Tax=Carpediemonas membranifera TaxID=201153 RepID=A0A8J6E8Z5_9EUKA|nr:LIS1 (LisH) motif [Carpediemonas membranifera]|eukprot:KAG9392605.1 LIS1 (LisH) motif [Carpediemonas membranifera]
MNACGDPIATAEGKLLAQICIQFMNASGFTTSAQMLQEEAAVPPASLETIHRASGLPFDYATNTVLDKLIATLRIPVRADLPEPERTEPPRQPEPSYAPPSYAPPSFMERPRPQRRPEPRRQGPSLDGEITNIINIVLR